MKLQQNSFYLLIIGVIIICISAKAQSTYINVNSGYGFNIASASRGSNITAVSSTSSTNKEVHGSYGKGLNFGLAFGYIFPKNIGAEIGMQYLVGSPVQISYTDNINTPPGLQTDEFKINMLRIIPSAIITVGAGKYIPYAKIGIAIGVMGKAVNTNTGQNGTNTSENVWEYTGGTAIGFASSLGIKVGKGRISFWGEIAMIGQSWAPTKKTQTISTQNGVDQLANMTTYQKETNYVESYTYTNPNASPVDPNSPQQTSKIYLPMSSLGINVGIYITLKK
ncbi:MAG: hypothetical protein WAQ28_06110 [Bacteroidia bacterium]